MKKYLFFSLAIFLVIGLLLPQTTLAQTSTELGNASTLGEWLSLLMTWIVTILGSLATLMMIYAGYLYMTSQGNPDTLGRAKDIILGVVTGIILLFLVEVIAVQTLGLNFQFSVKDVQNNSSTK